MRFLLCSLALGYVATGFAQPNRPPLPSPTHANVAYGDHPNQVIDFWKADIGGRGPLAIFIHGGGFTGGSKDRINPATVNRLLASGINVASFEYRFIEHAPLPAAHRDVARALQFVRSKAREWGIDSQAIGAFGGSAGAQLSAYLAFHDDMADQDSDDPIARQSTRLACVAPTAGQSTMDLDWWIGNIPGYDRPHRNLSKDYGVSGVELETRIWETSINNHITADDPPVYMSYAMAPDSRIPDENPGGGRFITSISESLWRKNSEALASKRLWIIRVLKPVMNPSRSFSSTSLLGRGTGNCLPIISPGPLSVRGVIR